MRPMQRNTIVSNKFQIVSDSNNQVELVYYKYITIK